jgi:phage baseplate assembly protein gpV
VERIPLLLAAVGVLALLGLSASLLFPSEGLRLRNVVLEGETLMKAEEVTLTGTLSPSGGMLIIQLSGMEARGFSLEGKIRMGADRVRAENVRVVVDPSKLENRGMGGFLLTLVEKGEEVELTRLRVRGMELRADNLYTGEILLQGMRL